MFRTRAVGLAVKGWDVFRIGGCAGKGNSNGYQRAFTKIGLKYGERDCLKSIFTMEVQGSFEDQIRMNPESENQIL